MKWSMIAAVALLSVAPAITPVTSAAGAAEDKREIKLQGCVVRGLEKDTFVLTQVQEITKDDASAIPPVAHGRRVIFWLSKDADFKNHVAEMVEVKGKIGETKESEIELKAGRQKDGGLIVEFEGPGKDVKVPNSAIGDAIGTAGQTQPGKNDIKTLLVKVDVDDVRKVAGYCQP